MSKSLDMSTASIISKLSQSQTSEYSESSSPPSLPKTIIDSPPLSRKEQVEQGKTPAVLKPLPVDIIDDKAPPTRAFILGHARYFAKTSLQFIFKDNNLPLLINFIYHLIVARSLILKPSKTVVRYVIIPPTLSSSSSPLRYQIEQTIAIATDSFRSLGVLHLALGVLSALALKERRQSTERSALLVLTLSAIGQTWAHFDAYWRHTGSQYTYKALKEVGSSNIFITLISLVALSKTIKRTGKLI